MKTLHILNLGAGVQSTALYLMSMRQDEPDAVPGFDYAIFADTQDEPDEVYSHLEWLKSLSGPPILTGTIGRLGDDLARGIHSTGQRFVSIPAFTAEVEGGKGGQMQRQCTREYKIDVITQVIRKDILNLAKGERFPKDKIHINQYIGLSFDEARRRAKVIARYYNHPWASCHFPLFDLFITRSEIRTWLKTQDIPHRVPRSACVFCPYHDNAEWKRIRDQDPAGWKRACEVDEALRKEGTVCNRGMDQSMYIHRQCVPLAKADLSAPEPEFTAGRFSFSGLGVQEQECEGMCGL